MLQTKLPKTKQTQTSAPARSKPEDVLQQEQQIAPELNMTHHFGRMLMSGNGTGVVVQPKLTVNQPGDKYEKEADRIADQVMQIPEPAVQRKCSKCEEEEQGVVQTKAQDNGSRSGSVASPSLEGRIGNAASGGSPLDAGALAFMEHRFGADFNSVRIHTGSKAESLNNSLSARAFTHGSDIYFNRGQYDPASGEGKRLLAHELTHVMQQGGKPQAIQRRLVVDPQAVIPLPPGVHGPPESLTMAAQGLINQTCPDGNFQVNTGSGNVTIPDPEFCEDWHPPLAANVKRVNNTTTPEGCRCLCNAINHSRTTTIGFMPGGPSTGPGSQAGAGPGHNGVQTDSSVSIDPRFQGQYLINGRWVDVPFFLLFSHELCGHALPKMDGTHAHRGPTPAGGTPPQEVHAVDVERRIAAEHGLPRRPNDYSGAARERP